MANSYIKFFKTNLYPDKNAWIDDIGTYLGTAFAGREAQYIKHALNLTIRLDQPQAELYLAKPNYVEIKNEDDNFSVYYFVMGYKWLSTYAVEITLSMDSINTWLKGKSVEEVFNPKTSIVREHLSRFSIEKGQNVYYRQVHKISEGITPTLKVLSNDIINSGINQSFYLIYKTKKDITPENISNPVECYCIADEALLLEKGQSLPSQVITSANLTEGLFYYITIDDNPDGYIQVFPNGALVRLNDELRVILLYKEADNIKMVTIKYDKVGDYYQATTKTMPLNWPNASLHNIKLMRTSLSEITTYTDILAMQPKVYNSGLIADAATIPFNALDRTDNRIVKIIKLPYYPTTFTINEEGILQYNHDIWEYKEGMLKLKDLNISFLSDVGKFNVNKNNALTYDLTSLTPFSDPDINAESKLFHSDFYTNKLVYDEFSYEFKHENISQPLFPNELNIQFKITNTINSKMLFKIDSLKNRRFYRGETDYEGYLFVDRNNEVVIYNSDYVNYIKTGFNYDKQKINQEKTYRWLGTGLQIAGSVVSGALSIATGNAISATASVAMATSAVASIASNINQSIANERNINSRLTQLANQKANINGADAIDLLEEYNGNRLHQITYDIANINTKLSIYKLFYFTGYSSPRKGVPKDGRVWFNFIQCEPVYNQPLLLEIPQEYLSDISARFNAGVTKYHQYQGVYNLEQDRENLEREVLIHE